MNRVVLHCDANGFYASCELVYAPHLRGLPVSVGGDAEARHGIILASNQHAKKYGVKTGMVLYQARKLCPNLVIIKPNFKRYYSFSMRLQGIYREYTPLVESYGLDESWLEITNPGVTLQDGKILADNLRDRIREELGLTISVGVSFNKIFAKLGSDYKKPDATTVITQENFRDIVWPLPAGDLLFVGPQTARKLAREYILTIGDIASVRPEYLLNNLGKVGAMHVANAQGLDNSPVMPVTVSHVIKSVGNSTTTPVDMISVEDVQCVFTLLAESVATRLREIGMAGRCINIHVRDTNLNIRACQTTISHHTALSGDITKAAMRLFIARDYASMFPLRSIGVSVSSLTDAQDPLQLDLFGDTLKRDRQLDLAKTVDQIRTRFGTQVIRLGNVLARPAFAVINPHDDHTIHPEQFYAG